MAAHLGLIGPYCPFVSAKYPSRWTSKDDRSIRHLRSRWVWLSRPQHQGARTRSRGKTCGNRVCPLPSTLPLSILCGVALTLITPIASFAFGSTVTTPLPNAAIIALSHTVCLVILGFTWFGLRRDIPLTWLYCIFLPVFTSIIFLLFACNNETGWVILFIGNGCYFLVSLLMGNNLP